MIDALAGSTAAGVGGFLKGTTNEPAQLAEVAAEFESLMLTEILKSMRDASSGGWLGDGEDQSGSIMIEVAEQQLARALASQGGLGLADLVTSGFRNEVVQDVTSSGERGQPQSPLP